jgi:xanthine dehydrogenase YagS FAD-binding subunit
MKSFAHINAASLKEAIGELKAPNTYINAGGTDIIGALKNKIFNVYPEKLVNIKNVPGLSYIKEESGLLKIGALTHLFDVETNANIKLKYTALSDAARLVASPQIRNTGTIAGNICQLNRCWYFRNPNNRFDCLKKNINGICYALTGDNRYHSIFGASSGCVAVNPSDIAPVLVALNATIVTTERAIPADEFFAVKVAPNGFGSTALISSEIITEIQIPAFTGKSVFLKFAPRRSIEFPVVNCAVAISSSSARVCLNAVSGTPKRAIGAEEAMTGKEINEENAEAAANAAVKGALDLGNNKYKIQIAKTLVKRAILACK